MSRDLPSSADAVTLTDYDSAPEHALSAVDAGLDQYNCAMAPVVDVSPLAVIATDSERTVIGGAVGRTWGDCCELLQLWVAAEHRSKGIAARLLRQFEARASHRGCRVFYLTTMSFQAPDFYRKHGYAAIAEIVGYPQGIAKFLMHKQTEQPRTS